MKSVVDHFSTISSDYDYYKKKNTFYYDNLKRLLNKLIPEYQNILEIGCATGDLLVSLKPRIGYGIDISGAMINIARNKYKNRKDIYFSTKTVEKFRGIKLDYIFMSDVIEHLSKPSKMFKDISLVMDNKTHFICTMANPIWEPVLMVAEKLKLKMPEGFHKRISYRELERILTNNQLKVVKHDYFLLMPVKIPFLTALINKYFECYLKRYAFIEYFIAKKD